MDHCFSEVNGKGSLELGWNACRKVPLRIRTSNKKLRFPIFLGKPAVSCQGHTLATTATTPKRVNELRGGEISMAMDVN